MTEFEMAYLQTEMLGRLGDGTQFFFTILTTFLVASYVAAHRLTRPMVVVVVSLFLLTALAFITSMFRQMESLAGLALQMKAFAAAGKGLQWSAVASLHAEWLVAVRYVSTTIFLIAIGGSVFFFFHCRRVNHKAELGAWKPKA